jgi:hypothetical protein
MAKKLPESLEIFRPGRHIDDAGVAREFTAEDLAATAAAYNPALREAPLTVGHPAHNLPAYGWVGGLAVNAAGRLALTSTRNVEPQFAEMVVDRRFPKRSASFYPPDHPNNPTPGVWYLRHVGFLGAQPPAISGLADFADDDADTVSFSEPEPASDTPDPDEDDSMSKELQAQLDAALADKAAAEKRAADEAAARTKAEATAKTAQDQLANFSEQQLAARHASHVSFAEAQVSAGKLLPKDQAMAVAVLDTLAGAQTVEFAEGDATRKVAPAEWFKSLFDTAKPVVSFGEHAPGSVADAARGAAKGKTDAEIDAAAKRYAKEKAVSYAEALAAVTFTD